MSCKVNKSVKINAKDLQKKCSKKILKLVQFDANKLSIQPLGLDKLLLLLLLLLLHFCCCRSDRQTWNRIALLTLPNRRFVRNSSLVMSHFASLLDLLRGERESSPLFLSPHSSNHHLALFSPPQAAVWLFHKWDYNSIIEVKKSRREASQGIRQHCGQSVTRTEFRLIFLVDLWQLLLAETKATDFNPVIACENVLDRPTDRPTLDWVSEAEWGDRQELWGCFRFSQKR